MDNAQRRQIAAEILTTVTMGPDEVLAMSDRIQAKRQARPELTALCKFGRSMQVRRLRNNGPKNWNPADWACAQAVLDEVAALRRDAGQPEQALALAVLGVRTDGLERALAALEQRDDDPALVAGIGAGRPADKPLPPERHSGKSRTK